MATKKTEAGSTPFEYWASGAGLGHLTPPGERWPEGEREKFLAGLRQLVGDGSVVEFGCGDGRLCRAFDPEKYLGIDICREVIDIALQENPGYSFARIGSVVPAMMPRDVVLAHTVFLHVPDAQLSATVSAVCRMAPRVMVSEILGREWRRPGNPPVFNRDEAEYERVFAEQSFRRQSTMMIPIARYKTFMSFLDFRQR